jgi:hypothetical protein
MKSMKLKGIIRDHQVTAALPETVPDGEAELVLLYEDSPHAVSVQSTRTHLLALFERIRRDSPGRCRSEIDRRLAEERAAWER